MAANFSPEQLCDILVNQTLAFSFQPDELLTIRELSNCYRLFWSEEYDAMYIYIHNRLIRVKEQTGVSKENETNYTMLVNKLRTLVGVQNSSEIISLINSSDTIVRFIDPESVNLISIELEKALEKD